MKGHGLSSLRKKASYIDRALTRIYGRHEVNYEDNPVDTLVETILSQNTTDKNSHRAFRALKAAYPRWEDLEGADPRSVASIIRSGGLADMKARRIINALRVIEAERGRLDLEFLRGMTPAQAESWLARIKGVGPKTRSIVLLFALRMPAFPVDTHIHRVTRRLGLIGLKTNRERAQEELALLVNEREYSNFHINLIEHGRAVCQARKPKCGQCRISSSCDFFAQSIKART